MADTRPQPLLVVIPGGTTPAAADARALHLRELKHASWYTVQLLRDLVPSEAHLRDHTIALQAALDTDDLVQHLVDRLGGVKR